MLARLMAMFTALTILFMTIGFLIGYVFFGDPLLFMGIGLAFSGIMSLISYEFADRFVLWSTHTRLINEADNPQLYRIVRNVAQTANIHMPRVGIVNSPQPNAFATGKNPEKAIVVATTGILGTLNAGELEAVIGHEISHVTHRDILVSSIAATLAGAISYVSQIFLWNTMWGGFGGRGRNQQDSGFLILAIVAAILVPIAAMLVQLGISRSRETFADQAGARLTRKPQELINALRKISSRANSRQWTPQNAPSPSTSSLWFVNPLRGSSWTELFSTHPSLEKRIAAIQKVAQDLGMWAN